jgi:hypothetical protein
MLTSFSKPELQVKITKKLRIVALAVLSFGITTLCSAQSGSRDWMLSTPPICWSIGATTDFIRHTATELQRRTADENAEIYYAQLAPKKKANLKAKKIRYLLVPTVRSTKTSPKAKAVHMTWDTQSESLVDNYAYEFENPPAVGSVVKVGGYTAEYTAPSRLPL